MRGGAVAEGEFGGVPAEPGGEFCGLEGGFSLGEECGGYASEDIAHATGGHAGMAGGVVGRRSFAFADEGAGAFEQERGGILGHKVLEPLAAAAGVFSGVLQNVIGGLLAAWWKRRTPSS